MENRSLSAKVVVVPRRSVFGFGRVFLWMFIHGAGTTLGTCLLSRESIEVMSNASGGIASMVVRSMLIVGVLTAVAVPRLYRHTPGWRILVYGAAYAIGLVVWKEAVLLPVASTGKAPSFLFPPGMAINLLMTGDLLVVGFVSCCLTWLVCRWIRGPILQQDGTLCPNCGYSLVGSTGQVCTECGREFTYQELETTREGLMAAAPNAAGDSPANAKPDR